MRCGFNKRPCSILYAWPLQQRRCDCRLLQLQWRALLPLIGVDIADAVYLFRGHVRRTWIDALLQLQRRLLLSTTGVFLALTL